MRTSADKDSTGFHHPKVQGSEDAGASLPLSGITILVVDDDYNSLEVLACALEISGAEISQASSVAEALALIDDDPPDVLISDIAMPGQDGYDLIRLVREHPLDHVRKVPALAITAFSNPERGNVLIAGFQDLIPKPVDLDYLVLRIAKLMSSKDSQAS